MATIQKRAVHLDGETMWNITYHKDGELVASSTWYSTEEQANNFIAQLLEKGN